MNMLIQAPALSLRSLEDQSSHLYPEAFRTQAISDKESWFSVRFLVTDSYQRRGSPFFTDRQ